MPSVYKNPLAPILSSPEGVSLLKVSAYYERQLFGSLLRLPMANDETYWNSAEATFPSASTVAVALCSRQSIFFFVHTSFSIPLHENL